MNKLKMNKKLISLVFVVISGAMLLCGCIGGGNEQGEPGFKKVPTVGNEKESEKEAVSMEENKSEETIKEVKPLLVNETKEAGKSPTINGTSGEVTEPDKTAETNAETDNAWCSGFDPTAKMEEQVINGKKLDICCMSYAGGNQYITFSNVRCISKDNKTELTDRVEIRNDGSGVKREKTEKWYENDKPCRRVTDKDGKTIEETCAII